MVLKDSRYIRDGFGRYIDKQYNNGAIYEGFFNTLLNGQGKVTHPDGTEEKGQFRNALLHGNGYRKLANGKIEQG